MLGAPNGTAKVALVSLYSPDAIGLRYISSFLKQNGVDAQLILFKEKNLEADTMSAPTEKEYTLLVGLLRDLEPDLIGLSLRSSFFRISSIITDRIRKELDAPIIWGGTHPNVAPDECIQVADMVCVGEGEQPMLELAERLAGGEDVRDVQNVWIRKDKEIVRNDLRPLLTDLDSLPFPDYAPDAKFLIEGDEISQHEPFAGRFNLHVMASRGCPYHCTYCCNSVFLENHRGKGPPIRRRSVDNVIEEIQVMRGEYPHLTRVDFIDEVFAWDRAWTSEFRSKYGKEIGLPFQCAQHPRMVDGETIRMLKEAGLERVEVGIQTGSERVRREIFERPVGNEDLIQTAHVVNSFRIDPFYDLIVDNPFETEQDRADSLEFLLRLPRPFHLRMFPLTYFPGTALTKRALDAKLITEERVENKLERTHSKWFVTLDYAWPDRERYWISLYSLTSKSFVPKWLIRLLARMRVLRRHPRPLSVFASVANEIKLGLIAVKWLFEGKPLMAILRHAGKGQSHWQI